MIKSLSLFFLLFLVGITHGFATETDDKLYPGNLLKFSFFESAALSKEFRIDPQGGLQLPELGKFNCNDQTILSLRMLVVKKLSFTYKNADDLIISKKNSDIYVTILGMVRKPGFYEVPLGANMQIALEKAGGLMNGAQMDQIQLRRQKQSTVINYKKYLDSGDDTLLPTLMVSDELFVPSSKLMSNIKLENGYILPNQGGDAANVKGSIKIFGAVNKPGFYVFNPKFSAIDYILKAGGTTALAEISHIKVIDSSSVSEFDLHGYLATARKELIPPVQENATIFIPSTAELAKPSSTTIYVMGQVQKPGAYELGKQANFMDAIANAGGPDHYAETRKIRIIHDNGKTEYFDMQAFTEGLTSIKLPVLHAKDVIYFPLKTDMNEKSWLDVPPNRAIKVIGAVLRPGRYEWANEMSILDLISNVGGPTSYADTAHIRIVSSDTKVRPVQFNLKQMIESGISSEGLPKLKSGDTVVVPELVTVPLSMNKSVKLIGEVFKPGPYVYNPNYSIVDYLLLAGGITHYAAPDQIKVLDNETSSIFNLTDYLETAKTKNMPVMKKGSTIFVPVANPQMQAGLRTVYVMGQVQKPGAYELIKSASFIDAVANAGGPDHYADTSKVRLIKKSGGIVYFDLRAYVDGSTTIKPPQIMAGDVIYIPIKPNGDENSWLLVAPNHAVKVMGAVKHPGRFEWSDEMSLIDLLAHAGGPTENADITNIRIVTNEHDKTGKMHATRFNLSKFVAKGGDLSSVPIIKSGYTIEVPELPRSPIDNKAIWTELDPKSTIYIFGEVGKPGRYAFNEGLNFLDILSAADGPTEKADLRDVHVIDRQGIYPQVVHVNLSLYFQTGDPELIPKVLPGDAIFLPQKSSDAVEINTTHVIKILGEVKNPGRYRFTSDMTILDLLAAAGGPTTQALVSKILIVNIGTRMETKASTFNLLKFSKTGDVFMLPALREGDVIYVPNNDEDFRKQFTILLQNLANAAIIVSQLGGLRI